MQTALKALNCLVADGVIENYAIGGAIGASFYLQAMQTEDIHVFVFLPPSSSLLVSLSGVYEALKAQGGTVQHEYVRFDEWPVQILTDATPLIAEAIREATEVEFEGIPTRVFRPEHLCALALQTGRAKDYARVTMFLEQNEVDPIALHSLAVRHGLTDQLARVVQTSRNHWIAPMIDEGKAAFNARAKASMLQYLKSKTWPEKIRSIERMNAAAKAAREAMRKARAQVSSSPPCH